MAAAQAYARWEWLRSTGVRRSSAASRACRASDESGGARRAGSMVARRPECTRRASANRLARRPSSSRRSGRASVTHSRAVRTPPVRSVQPIDPSGSLEPARSAGLVVELRMVPAHGADDVTDGAAGFGGVALVVHERGVGRTGDRSVHGVAREPGEVVLLGGPSVQVALAGTDHGQWAVAETGELGGAIEHG